MRAPDFTDQVYELLDVAHRVDLTAGRFKPAPVELELAWVVPADTHPAAATSAVPLDRLFGFPVQYGDVDRPQLIIRPVRLPEPGPHAIGSAMGKVMRDYDRGADTLLGGVL